MRVPSAWGTGLRPLHAWRTCGAPTTIAARAEGEARRAHGWIECPRIALRAGFGEAGGESGDPPGADRPATPRASGRNHPASADAATQQGRAGERAGPRLRQWALALTNRITAKTLTAGRADEPLAGHSIAGPLRGPLAGRPTGGTGNRSAETTACLAAPLFELV